MSTSRGAIALADTFVAAHGVASSSAMVDRNALDASLREIAARARATWPGVDLDEETFAAWVAERVPDEVDPVSALGALHAVDLYLACGCARGDARAVSHFEDKIMPSALPAIARIDPDRAFGREIAEQVRVRLLVDGEDGPARIRNYIGRGPLTSWVQVAAMRLAYGEKRGRRDVHPVDLDRLAGLPIAGDDAEMAQIRAQFAEPFARAFREALTELPARDRNVLRLHLLEGLSTDTIGKMYRVHRATVARWIAATHDALLSATKKRLARDLGLRHGELESFVRLLSSQLEISIVSALSR